MTHAMSLLAVRDRLQAQQDADRLRSLFEDPELQTPVLLLSPSEVGRNFRALQQALPRADIHYAVKPNNHQGLIDEVYRLGGGFDVCSAGEIAQVLPTGIEPTDLIHSHPVKSLHEFDRAVQAGIEIFVVDNIDEVKKLARYTHRRLKILVRFRINVNSKAVVNLQYKFGCKPADVPVLARQVELLGHEFHGLCFHVGSQCIYPENYVRAIETAHELISTLDQAGLSPSLLDIGGGFPVPYIEPVPDIDSFCRPISKALDEHIRPEIRIASEPGRFIAASPVTLVASIIGKSVRNGRVWYYLDDGLYSTFSGIVYDHCRYPVVTCREGQARLSVLAGPTCDSFDVMYSGLMLPEHEVGDRLVFLSTGAYCAVSGSNFNALRRPEYQLTE
jgi:ornithine decarboxylase